MKIYVDADGCPVVDIAIKIAKEFNLPITIVKNYAHRIINDYAEIVSVDISKDSADLFIVNHINENDIIVTQDYGLAAMALSKKAFALNQNGLEYTNNNIEGMLNRRHIHRELRKQGNFHSKARKRQAREDRYFEANLRKIIENKRSENNA